MDKTIKTEKNVEHFLTRYISRYIFDKEEVIDMLTAKVFTNGRSQAVRLPKECRFEDDEVAVKKIGDIVLLMPKSQKWELFDMALDMFTDDFMEDGRPEQLVQERDTL